MAIWPSASDPAGVGLAFLLQENLSVADVIPDIHPDKLYVMPFEFPVYLGQDRGFHPARCAPRGPKVHHHDLAT